MKKFKIGLIALSLSGFFFTGIVNASSTDSSNIEVKSSTANIAQNNSVSTDGQPENKKEEKPTFVITKASVYQQLSYDLRQQGYRLSWKLNQDFKNPINNKVYKTWQDKLLAMVDVINKEGLYNDANRTTVQALICPQTHYIVITSLENSAGVVDLNKRGCNLISKAPSDEDEDNQYLQSNSQDVDDTTYNYTPQGPTLNQNNQSFNNNNIPNQINMPQNSGIYGGNQVDNDSLNPTPNINPNQKLQAFPAIDQDQNSGPNISSLNN